MSDLITLNTPSIPMDAADEIANAFGLGGNMQSQINTFIRNNPRAAEEAAKLGMDIETYYMSQILNFDVGQSGVNQYGDSNQNIVQEAAGVIDSVAKGNFTDAAADAADLASKSKIDVIKENVPFLGELDEYVPLIQGLSDPLGSAADIAFDTLNNIPFVADTTEMIQGGISNIQGRAQDFVQDVGESIANTVEDSEGATVMDSSSAGGFLRDDITGEGTFLGGANTLMEDDERINYDTDTSGSEQGSSGMDSRFEEYYKILREQGPQAAEIYAENLGLFIEGVAPALFGTARQYTDEQLRALGRSVGIRDGSVPTIQEITQAGVVLDPNEEKRVMDVLMGSQVASGRQFDSSIGQRAIDMNQMMYNRREPFIKAGINASSIAPGIEFGGGIAATMEGALPTFADKFKMDQADIQNEFNQQLLASQESASDINKILGTVNALTGAYDANLFGFQDLITNTLQGLGIGGRENQFVMEDDTLEDLYKKYITGGG
tara:strand:- start:7467 stop:8942 length:1476 start_codon:yes stop_codon:yes gene_type:complete